MNWLGSTPPNKTEKVASKNAKKRLSEIVDQKSVVSPHVGKFLKKLTKSFKNSDSTSSRISRRKSTNTNNMLLTPRMAIPI